MRSTIQYGIAFLLFFAALFPLLYKGVSRVFQHHAELFVTLKSVKPTSISLLYASKSQHLSPAQMSQLFFNSTQFFSNIVLQIPQPSQTENMQLRFSGGDNLVTIEKVGLNIIKPGRRDTLMIWPGRCFSELISESQDIALLKYNKAFSQFQIKGNDPYIQISDSVHAAVERYYARTSITDYKSLLTSLIIVIFLGAILIYLLRRRLSSQYLNKASQSGGVLVCGFLAVIFGVFVNNNFGYFSDLEVNENRKAAVKPELSSENFFDFPDLLTNYCKDNFSFRNYLFFANSYIRMKIFNASPLRQEIIAGKNGWMFYNDAGSIEDTRGLSAISPNELMGVSKNMSERQRWLAGKNIKFYVIIPPNKDRIYPEYLPDGYTLTGNREQCRLDMYKMFLAESIGMHVIDPTEALIAAKKKRELYFKTDTHWNAYGGFIGYTCLMKEIEKDFPDLHAISERDIELKTSEVEEGDIAQMVGLQRIYKRKEFLIHFKDTTKRLFPPTSSELVLRFKNPDSTGKKLKLLMFRDSYANYLIPYLNTHVKEAVYLWTYDFLDEFIEQEKPDIVIFECLQRFALPALLTPNSAALQ